MTGSPFTRLRRPVADPPNAVVKQVDPETRAMIDRAVADGRVTKCPPMTFALDANEEAKRWFAGGRNSRAKRAKAKREASREARRR